MEIVIINIIIKGRVSMICEIFDEDYFYWEFERMIVIGNSWKDFYGLIGMWKLFIIILRSIIKIGCWNVRIKF